MSPATRVALGATSAVVGALLLVAAFSDHWFHAPYSSNLRDVNWIGFGGPSDHEIGMTLRDAMTAIAGMCALLAALCAFITAFGTVAGRRRDHVPRLPALLCGVGAASTILLQALEMTKWDVGEQIEPHGFGWAMPAFFASGLALAGCVAALWRDASKRARASAAALAKVNRELAARDLAAMPDAVAEEPPVERV